MTTDAAYLKNLGARILSESNDLKRTPEALARELSLDFSDVMAVIEGRTDLAAARALVDKMTEIYPVRFIDIWLEPDDTDRGALFMTKSQSAETSRIFNRCDRHGELTPYYEYRDTAMSRNGPFKPEWIAQLRTVDDAEPDNPDVIFNNGHLLHQTTFFIGPVNFYWETDGKRHCAELNTGDSNYITPFVPHSFTRRDTNVKALIIAVTYSAGVRGALSELGLIGPEVAEELAGSSGTGHAFCRHLRHQMAAESLDDEDLALRLERHGLNRGRTQALLSGAKPSDTELSIIATSLSVLPGALLPSACHETDDVILCKKADSTTRSYPAGNEPIYELTDMARTPYQPDLKGFDVEVLGCGGGEMRHSLHEYIFVYGNAPVRFVWDGDRQTMLEPGDSAYLQPMVEHRFERVSGAEAGRLAMVRVPGQLTATVLDEYAGFDVTRRARACKETQRWF